MRDLKDLLQSGYCARVTSGKEICDECKKYFGKCTEKKSLTANDFMEYAKANFKPEMTKEEAQEIMIKFGICNSVYECHTASCDNCAYATSVQERERAWEVLKND